LFVCKQQTIHFLLADLIDLSSTPEAHLNGRVTKLNNANINPFWGGIGEGLHRQIVN